VRRKQEFSPRKSEGGRSWDQDAKRNKVGNKEGEE
jgi:hypothetical protein